MNTIIDEKILNCFHFLAVHAAKRLGCDYRLMMLELWGFKYEVEHPPIVGERLGLCWNSKLDTRKKLLNYHGLTFDTYQFNESICQHILGMMDEDKIVAIYIDSYNCEWLPFYKNMHRNHALILTHTSDEVFIAKDQYSSCIKLDMNFVELYAQKVIVFQKLVNPTKADIKDYLCDKLYSWDVHYFDEYNKFKYDMENILDIKKEIIGEPISSKLVMHLKNLADDRRCFTETISLLEEVYFVGCTSMRNLLISISDEFEKIRMHIVKCSYLAKRPSPQKISESLEKIINCEKMIYSEIKTLLL